MNIGIDIKSLVYGYTGIGRYIRCLLDALQLVDSENSYYLFEHRESNYAPANRTWKKISQSWKLSSTLWQQLVLPSLLKKYNIDILWAPEQLCPALWPLHRVKIVTTIHDFVILRYPKTCQFSDLIIKKLLLTQTIKKSAALIPVSDYIKDELLRFYPCVCSEQKIVRTVANGTKSHAPIDRHAKRENFLFFPGNMEPRKNLSKLISALEAVNAAGFGIDLHICGPAGWKNRELKDLINASPIKNRIKHIGYVTDNELINQYLTCKALVYPSIYEGFGIPVLEALSLGTPVLTSKGTVMEEIAGKNAMYFDPHDVDSIASAIVRFLTDGGVPINRESLRQYSWEQSAKDLLSVFEKLNLN